MTTTTMLAMVIKEKVGWSSWGWFPIRVVLMRISLIRLVLWVSHQGGLYVAKFSLRWSLWGWSLIRVVFMRVVSHQCGPWVVSHQCGLYEGCVSSGWSLWGWFQVGFMRWLLITVVFMGVFPRQGGLSEGDFRIIYLLILGMPCFTFVRTAPLSLPICRIILVSFGVNIQITFHFQTYVIE